MTHDEALATGLAYAWGFEDASGETTQRSIHYPGGIPSYEFALAFAIGWDDMAGERRFFMVSVTDAYRRWNESRGESIFPLHASQTVCKASETRNLGDSPDESAGTLSGNAEAIIADRV